MLAMARRRFYLFSKLCREIVDDGYEDLRRGNMQAALTMQKATKGGRYRRREIIGDTVSCSRLE